jgi:hypothetical protein
MKRPFLLFAALGLLVLAALACVWCPGTISIGAPASEPMPESAAQRHGLTRAWFTQMQVDPARGRLKDLILDRGMLFVLSDQSMLSAIDASTGETRWTVEVGSREYPTLAPAANRKFVAVVNGSTLHVLNRHNGQLLWKKRLEAAPGAGPAVSPWRIYVPLLDGRLVCYRMKPVKESQAELAKKAGRTPDQQSAGEAAGLESLRLEQDVPPPLSVSSPGKAIMPPSIIRQTLAEEDVIWATDAGYLCCGRVDLNDERSFALRYRLKTDGPIAAPPCYLPPDANVVPDSGVILATSEDGYVYAIRARDGSQLWRFSTGEPITESPIALGRFVFVTNQLGGMHCLDAKTGEQTWWTPEVTRFLAASKERVYATDKVGLLRVLSAKTGTQLDTIAAQTLPIKFTNTESDRLFLASNTGMLECLYEPELSQPLVRHIPAQELEKPEKPKTATKGEEQAPSETHKPVSKPSSGSKPSSAPKATGSKTGTKTAAKGKKAGPDFGAGDAGKKKKRKGGMPGMPGMAPGKAPGAN